MEQTKAEKVVQEPAHETSQDMMGNYTIPVFYFPGSAVPSEQDDGLEHLEPSVMAVAVSNYTTGNFVLPLSFQQAVVTPKLEADAEDALTAEAGCPAYFASQAVLCAVKADPDAVLQDDSELDDEDLLEEPAPLKTPLAKRLKNRSYYQTHKKEINCKRAEKKKAERMQKPQPMPTRGQLGKKRRNRSWYVQNKDKILAQQAVYRKRLKEAKAESKLAAARERARQLRLVRQQQQQEEFAQLQASAPQALVLTIGEGGSELVDLSAASLDGGAHAAAAGGEDEEAGIAAVVKPHALTSAPLVLKPKAIRPMVGCNLVVTDPSLLPTELTQGGTAVFHAAT